MDLENGKLWYNHETKRYEFFPDNGGREIALHCGYCLDVYRAGRWVETRIEMGDDDWYLVGTKLCGKDLEGLKVRF